MFTWGWCKIKCPYCKGSATKVIDSREIDDQTRRRRECEECNKRFTTYERVENLTLNVLKNDGSKEPFSKEKMKKGILNACAKRPVTLEQIDNLVDCIEQKIRSLKSIEIPSKKIGQLVMKKLSNLDHIAYLRYASVHKQFKNVKEFKEEIKIIQKR